MSQQPARCPRTTYELGLTWLAGGGPRPPRRPRRAYFIHGGGGSICRHEARDLVVYKRHHHLGRPLRRANEARRGPLLSKVKYGDMI